MHPMGAFCGRTHEAGALKRPPIMRSSMDAIRKTAAERGKKLGLSYAGAVLPAEAHELMKAGVKLVDVRTRPELQYVGKIPGTLAIEWQTWPGGKPNPEFVGELVAAVSKDEPV